MKETCANLARDTDGRLKVGISKCINLSTVLGLKRLELNFLKILRNRVLLSFNSLAYENMNFERRLLSKSCKLVDFLY